MQIAGLADKTPAKLWLDDLDAFEKAYKGFEAGWNEDYAKVAKAMTKKPVKMTAPSVTKTSMKSLPKPKKLSGIKVIQ